MCFKPASFPANCNFRATLRRADTTSVDCLYTQPGAIVSTFNMRFLPAVEYTPTQPFTLPHFTIIVYTLGILWTTLITILNVAAVGYDTVQIFSTSFNSTTPVWYERFAPISWLFPVVRNGGYGDETSRLNYEVCV